MSADERSVLGATPDFGAVAQRLRLVTLIDSHAPGLTLIVAPSGYGKSVLAAQYVLSRPAARCVWLESSMSPGGLPTMLRALIDGLDVDTPVGDPPGQSVRPLRCDPEDLVLAAARAVSRLEDPRETVIVFDDLTAVEDESARHLVSFGRTLRGLGARLIVTTREVSPSAACLHDSQVLDADDLRLAPSEAAAVASAIIGDAVAEPAVASLSDICLGHPATFAVLARHARLHQEGWEAGSKASVDLRYKLMHIAHTSLRREHREALFAMALLGRGTTSDIVECGLECTAQHLNEIGNAIPLVRLPVTHFANSPLGEFGMHDLARDVFASDEYVTRYASRWLSVWPRAVALLACRGETVQAASIIERWGTEPQIVDWLVKNGDRVVSCGGSSCLVRMVQRLPVSRLVGSPRLLLVYARLLQEQSRFGEAVEKANVAIALAEAERDEGLIAAAMLVAAECHAELGCYVSALSVLRDLLSTAHAGLTQDQKAWALAAMAGGSMQLGEGARALELAAAASSMARDSHSSSNVQSYVLAVSGAIATLARGDVAASLAHFGRAAESVDVPKALQAKAQGNKAVALCEMGRLERCIDSVGLTLQMCADDDHGVIRGSYLPVRGAALVALGLTDSGMRDFTEGVQLSEAVGDRYQTAYNRIYMSTALRALGRGRDALSEAEVSLEAFVGLDASSQRELATLELAASLLALDDVAAATRTVESVRSRMSGLNLYHLLRADMILAEIERRSNHLDKAIARLTAHEEYILTESSNWQMAMYCRAFPVLLGVFALAIGTERLPVHMLRMIPPQNAEVVLDAVRHLLSNDTWLRLGERLLGAEGLAEYIGREGKPLCRVRLFGGLEVSVGGRVVSERDWRKRKARLLFAMLVIRGGKDVPRDQVLDHLWPEMDEARAKNNLYVIWSAMKSALSPEAGKNESCPFIDNTGAVCRTVTGSVRSDVEEFDQVMSKARLAESAGDESQALNHYERLSEIYRGELLPGDVYDDWFAQIRDEYRATYADAMLSAASILQRREDALGALRFVRRALAQDPWREDLYQAAMSCQIAAGQRSAAIETYLQCRARLTEDLGLDPSADTRALYDQILAMEERPAPHRHWPEA